MYMKCHISEKVGPSLSMLKSDTTCYLAAAKMEVVETKLEGVKETNRAFKERQLPVGRQPIKGWMTPLVGALVCETRGCFCRILF